VLALTIQNTATAPTTADSQASELRAAMRLPGRLHFLDALRGLAALGVMLFHFAAKSVSPLHDPLVASLPGWISWPILHMDCGVEIFFVLSGFVIALSVDGIRHDLRYAGNFVLRRSLRLDPTYWAAAGLLVIYWLIRWPQYAYEFYVLWGGLRGVLANMFYVQNLSFIYPTSSILGVSWTLCLEVQFYLCYLLVLVIAYYTAGLAGRHRHTLRDAVVMITVASLGIWSLSHWLQQHTADFTGRSWMFLLGVATYAALRRNIPALAAATPFAALAICFCWRGDLEGIVATATASSIYGVGATGRLGRALAYRPLLYLGRISYSLYLMHMVVGIYVLFFLHGILGDSIPAAWACFILAIAASLISAELLHRCVEAPSNRLSRRLKLAAP